MVFNISFDTSEKEWFQNGMEGVNGLLSPLFGKSTVGIVIVRNREIKDAFELFEIRKGFR